MSYHEQLGLNEFALKHTTLHGRVQWYPWSHGVPSLESINAMLQKSSPMLFGRTWFSDQPMFPILCACFLTTQGLAELWDASFKFHSQNLLPVSDGSVNWASVFCSLLIDRPHKTHLEIKTNKPPSFSSFCHLFVVWTCSTITTLWIAQDTKWKWHDNLSQALLM